MIYALELTKHLCKWLFVEKRLRNIVSISKVMLYYLIMEIACSIRRVHECFYLLGKTKSIKFVVV